MSVAISFDRVSKHYRRSAGYVALRDDLAAFTRRLLRRDTGPRWTIDALTDVSFEIEEGAAVGLIGPNGAGKTTALKVMSRITYPTGGSHGSAAVSAP